MIRWQFPHNSRDMSLLNMGYTPHMAILVGENIIIVVLPLSLSLFLSVCLSVSVSLCETKQFYETSSKNGCAQFQNQEILPDLLKNCKFPAPKR